MNRKKLSKEAIFRLQHPKNRRLILKMRDVLDVHKSTVQRLLRENVWNGSLTLDAVLDLLSAELNMQRAEILECEEINTPEYEC